jgi:farnesyl diphosphate synthase
MDNADFRRGVSTIHKKYDEVTAILVGDALNTLPFEILAKAPFRDDVKIDLIRSLSENGGLNGMIIGQAIDCYFENKPLTIEQVRFLHQHKTGKLIASALEMGGIIVGDKVLSKKLFDFGLTLGLLFQIQDDILDKIETDEVAGKPTNHDENKNSFVTLLGLENAIKEANIEAEKSLKLLKTFPKNLQLNLEKNLIKYIFRHKK